MYLEDQEARSKVINTGILGSEDGKKIVEEIDQKHLPCLKAIVKQFGWPGFQLIGTEGANQMWLLVQHCDSDIEFQKTCLFLLKEAADKGDASKEHVAYLTDRVLVNEGKPQIYGTQILIINGEAVPKPMEDPTHLDKRRKEMGLCPLADYLSLFKEISHLIPPESM